MKNNCKTHPPRLSEAEWSVMKPFWDNGPMAARDLYDQLPENHGWSSKTVKTMLARLVKKGAIEYTAVGNSYLYQPCYSREEMIRTAVKSFSQRVLDGALQPFLLNFFEGRKPTREDLDTLRDMIQHFEKKETVNKKGRK